MSGVLILKSKNNKSQVKNIHASSNVIPFKKVVTKQDVTEMMEKIKIFFYYLDVNFILSTLASELGKVRNICIQIADGKFDDTFRENYAIFHENARKADQQDKYKAYMSFRAHLARLFGTMAVSASPIISCIRSLNGFKRNTSVDSNGKSKQLHHEIEDFFLSVVRFTKANSDFVGGLTSQPWNILKGYDEYLFDLFMDLFPSIENFSEISDDLYSYLERETTLKFDESRKACRIFSCPPRDVIKTIVELIDVEDAKFENDSRFVDHSQDQSDGGDGDDEAQSDSEAQSVDGHQSVDEAQSGDEAQSRIDAEKFMNEESKPFPWSGAK